MDAAEKVGQSPGKLKIFLGYAPGVGARQAMLEAARRAQSQGDEVLVAFPSSESGLSASTTDTLFEFVSTQPAAAEDGKPVLDTLLDRHPRIVLLEGLHQTNPAPARHRKRYQDMQDLLDAGVDVFTTLHIQHLESLNDVVRQITGLDIRETVPDRVLEGAAEIEVVDLPPEDLVTRYEAGAFVPTLSAEEARRFYRHGNLYALRELTLRRAADWVDTRLRTYMQQRAIPGPWAATERLMVCVGPSPLSERLVRAAQRLARDLDAEWLAVHVQTPADTQMSIDARERIWRTLHYARTLGGEPVTLTGASIPERIIEYARRHNITKIIVGKPLKPAWRDLFRGSPVDRIIRLSRNIDVYVISSEEETAGEFPHPHPVEGGSWLHYVQSVGLVVAATLLGFPIDSFLSPTNLVMLYLVAVVIAATRLGRGPAVLAAFLSVLGFDYFFVPPRLTLVVADTEYLLTFAGLLSVGLVISTLVSQVRERTRTAQQREEQTTTLYALSRALAAAGNVEAIAQAVIRQVQQIFGREAVVLLADDVGMLSVHPAEISAEFDEAELEIAQWVLRHARSAGHGTDTLSQGRLRYVPLITSRGVVGVLGVRPAQGELSLSPEQTRLLEAFSSQASLAVERALLAKQAQQAQILRATEQFQSALLNSISHDLRTPLVSITGVLSSLREAGGILPDTAHSELIETAYEEAGRLNRLVGNLLDITRIEGGALHLNRELCDVEDLIGAALAALNGKLAGYEVTIQVDNALPLVSMDFVLMNQVVINLLDNAVKYSPAGSGIDIVAGQEGPWMALTVADRGRGIPAAELERVFEKFYRVSDAGGVVGTGLGLSISKGIVETHGGCIQAENRKGGGTRFTLRLPLEEAQRGGSDA